MSSGRRSAVPAEIGGGAGPVGYHPVQTVTSVGVPDPVIPEPAGSGSGLPVAVLALIALVVVFALAGRRPRFRRPRYLADSSPRAVRTVEGAWDEAVVLQQGLVADRRMARGMEEALEQLRRHVGDGPLTEELKRIEAAAAQLRSNLDRSADSAARIARRLQDD